VEMESEEVYQNLQRELADRFGDQVSVERV